MIERSASGRVKELVEENVQSWEGSIGVKRRPKRQRESKGCPKCTVWLDYSFTRTGNPIQPLS